MVKRILIPICFLIILVACTSKSTATQSQKSETKSLNIPSFSADSAYSYVEAQCNFGARVPASEAHAQCLEYFINFFNANGADSVIVQEATGVLYDGRKMPIRNVIAQYNTQSQNRIMLCAHWDSRPYADHDPNAASHRTPIIGANDGASGVGVLMEIARLLNNNPQNIGIDIILFDLEDWGAPEWVDSRSDDGGWCLGSKHWAKSPHTPGYQAQYAILLDMVGAANAVFYREYFSDRYASWLVDKVWNRAAELGYSDIFVNKRGGAVTDDHVPVNEHNGTPCIDIIHYDPNTESGFGDFWHTHNDDIQSIDKNMLGKVGTVLVNLIYNP